MQKAGKLDTKEALFSLNRIQTKKDPILNHQSPTTGHWHLLNLNPMLAEKLQQTPAIAFHRNRDLKDIKGTIK